MTKALHEIVNAAVPDVIERTPRPDINWRSVAVSVGMQVGAQASNQATSAERERCARILRAAQVGEIARDLDGILIRIESGAPFPETDN